MRTFVQRVLVDGIRLQAHMARSQYERQCGQNNAVHAANDGQRIGPAYAAEAQLESVRLRATDLAEIIRIPAKGKRSAGHNHAER